MTVNRVILIVLPLFSLIVVPGIMAGGESTLVPQEKHLSNLRQLTFSGKNAAVVSTLVKTTAASQMRTPLTESAVRAWVLLILGLF
jgi:hypothetical protein